jgi:mono/diheme cytochrome c family protein
VMQQLRKHRWWIVAAVAVVVVSAVLISPVLSANAPPAPAPAEEAGVPAWEAHPASPASEETQQTSAPVALQPSSDNCIACHTNQALLEQMAEEPEEVVSELAAGEG